MVRGSIPPVGTIMKELTVSYTIEHELKFTRLLLARMADYALAKGKTTEDLARSDFDGVKLAIRDLEKKFKLRKHPDGYTGQYAGSIGLFLKAIAPMELERIGNRWKLGDEVAQLTSEWPMVDLSAFIFQLREPYETNNLPY